VLILLGLLVHYSSAPRKTSSRRIWLIRKGFPAHFPQSWKRPDPAPCILKPEPSPMLQLEFHQLDRRLESLRVRHPARQRRLIASLAESGQQTPIIVIESAGRYLVIDGHQRIAALQQLGRDTVDAVVWEMSEAEALVLERSLRSREPETALEQGWLLAEMESRLGCSIEELARRFDRSPSWVASRLALVETLPQSVQQSVREGKIAAPIAMRYLVPVARINTEHCQRMAEAFAEQPWTPQQAGELYRAWRAASGVVRERILAAPKLFRKAQEQPSPLEKELNQITAIAQRALERLESPPPNRAAVRRKIERATALLAELQQRIEEPETNHVEPSATGDDSRTAGPGNPETRDRAAAESLPPQRPPSVEGQLQRRAEDRAGRESHPLPPADPRVAALAQRQSRASP
jgi:ParB family chromosome partitioning protein